MTDPIILPIADVVYFEQSEFADYMSLGDADEWHFSNELEDPTHIYYATFRGKSAEHLLRFKAATNHYPISYCPESLTCAVYYGDASIYGTYMINVRWRNGALAAYNIGSL